MTIVQVAPSPAEISSQAMRERGVVEAGAALRLGDRDAVQPHRARGPSTSSRGKSLSRSQRAALRRELLARVAAHRVADLLVVRGEGHLRCERT